MIVEQKSTDEVIQVTFPYAKEIGTATITGTVVTVTMLGGSDPTPAAILLGVAQISGNEVRQLVQNGVAGARYKLHCLATMNDTRKLASDYGIEVLPP